MWVWVWVWVQAKLVFATVSTAGRSEMLSAAGRSGFDVAVLDEASQVSDQAGRRTHLASSGRRTYGPTATGQP